MQTGCDRPLVHPHWTQATSPADPHHLPAQAGVGWGDMGAGEKGHTGNTATPAFKPTSPRMEPPDVGSPLLGRVNNSHSSILLGICRRSRLKWQGAGSGGEDRQQSWLRGRFLYSRASERAAPAPLEARRKVTSTPGLVSTQQTQLTASGHHPQEHSWESVECTRGA